MNQQVPPPVTERNEWGGIPCGQKSVRSLDGVGRAGPTTEGLAVPGGVGGSGDWAAAKVQQGGACKFSPDASLQSLASGRVLFVKGEGACLSLAAENNRKPHMSGRSLGSRKNLLHLGRIYSPW